MSKQDIITSLRDNSICWTRFGFGFDPPKIDENGEFVLFDYNFDKYLKIHKDFYKAGVRFHSTILPNCWLGVDKYDFRAIDRVLDALFSELPNIYYIPRIKLNVPVDWCMENPEEVFVYNNGPRTADEIKKAVGTLKHDYLGYNSLGGYNGNGGGAKDSRPNMDGIIALQSFSSQKWLCDAGEALKKTIEHLEKSKYASQIIGYHIAYGACGETITWGTWSNDINRKGDFGITATKEFLKYAPQYDDVPKSEKRYKKAENLREFFRADINDKICIDYSKFISDVNANAIEYFCKIVNELAPSKLAGVFNTYIIGTLDAAYSGHLAIDRLLNSPYIDFISAPKGYYRHGPYGPGLEQAPSNSVALKKLWLDEIDNKTFLHPVNSKDKAKDFEETRYVLMREFSKNLSFNQGFWWMDLGENCFDDERILSDIKLMGDTASEVREEFGDGKRIAEILLLIDENSMHHMVPSNQYQSNFVKDFACNIKECGAPVDFYRLSDVKEIDLKKYKIIFFLNAFCISEQLLSFIMANTLENTTLVWNYAAGIIDKYGFSIDNIKRTTGFEVKELNNKKIMIPIEYASSSENEFPLIYISDANESEVIKAYDDGRAMIAKRKLRDGHISILLSLPQLSIDEIYDILKDASVHIYADKDCVVYGDSRFIYVMAEKDLSFELKLKNIENCVDIVTGKQYINAIRLPVSLKKGHGIFLKYTNNF